MSATYIYAIIPTGEEVVFDVAGMDNHDDRVYSIPHGDVAAVVSASPVVDYRGLKRDEAVRHLVAHQGVVEAVMQEFAVLPVKFGTVLPDQARVHRLLAQGRKLFRTALEKLTGLVQMEVVVLWGLEEVFQEIAQEEPIAGLKAQVQAQRPQEMLAERVAIGQMVKSSLERRRGELEARLVAPLREVAIDLVVNPPMDDRMVTNVALLMDRSGCQALERQLEALDKEFGGRLHFRCIGPLPPYSFATIEVRVPSFPEVDAARRSLGVGEMASLDEIKVRYRRAASRLHPDLNPQAPETQAHMAELTRAYELLTAYAESYGLGAEGAQQAVCSFHREAVEQTLLIALQGQTRLA